MTVTSHLVLAFAIPTAIFGGYRAWMAVRRRRLQQELSRLEGSPDR